MKTVVKLVRNAIFGKVLAVKCLKAYCRVREVISSYSEIVRHTVFRKGAVKLVRSAVLGKALVVNYSWFKGVMSCQGGDVKLF